MRNWEDFLNIFLCTVALRHALGHSDGPYLLKYWSYRHASLRLVMHFTYRLSTDYEEKNMDNAQAIL